MYISPAQRRGPHERLMSQPFSTRQRYYFLSFFLIADPQRDRYSRHCKFLNRQNRI